ncbi:MAG: class I SAM-dependent methyltransferase [Bacteroidota bacterium]
MNTETLKDIIDWDTVNWSKALKYWEDNVNLENKNLKCLEVGGRKGGLALWLAMKGNSVVCSDLESPEKFANEVHEKYECKTLIQYQAIDATNIPYENSFDIVAFKSVLGGISRNNNDALKQKTINEIYKALKDNGVLLFAENIESSFFHRIVRKYFVEWGNEWNYLKVNEVENLFSSFKSVNYITVGFWGAFGRTEKQRTILGRFDRLFEAIVPKGKRYILIGVAKK